MENTASVSRQRMLKILVTLIWTSTLILVILPATVSSQLITVTSNITDGEKVCPGEEVIFTCETRGSLTIAWMSDEYINDRLEFNTGNDLNDMLPGSIDSNTIATFVNSTRDENGVRVLVSELQIIVSSTSLTPSVTCVHVRNDIPETITFQVLALPGVPDIVTATYMMESCALSISWTAPNNIAIDDINHFMIYINEINICNKTNINNDTFLSLSCPISSCNSHNVSISAVNRCGHKGPLSSVTTVSPESFCDSVCGVNAGPGVNNTLLPAILGGVLGPAAAILIGVLVVVVIVILVLKKKNKEQLSIKPE